MHALCILVNIFLLPGGFGPLGIYNLFNKLNQSVISAYASIFESALFCLQKLYMCMHAIIEYFTNLAVAIDNCCLSFFSREHSPHQVEKSFWYLFISLKIELLGGKKKKELVRIEAMELLNTNSNKSCLRNNKQKMNQLKQQL